MDEIIDIQELIRTLVKEVGILRKENRSLQEENTALREKLSRYAHPRDSHNSHLPSSKDPIGKKKNLRVSTGRSSGGQKGHQGNTLNFVHPTG